MNDEILEELEEKGEIILSVFLDGDSPGSGGWITIYHLNNFYYGTTDYEEYIGPVASFEEAMQWEVFDFIGIDYEVTSDHLPIEKLEAIKADIEARIAKSQMD